MDLSFPLPATDDADALAAADQALLLAELARRQPAGDHGAIEVDTTGEPPLAPADGAFNGAMAARLTAWTEE